MHASGGRWVRAIRVGSSMRSRLEGGGGDGDACRHVWYHQNLLSHLISMP